MSNITQAIMSFNMSYDTMHCHNNKQKQCTSIDCTLSMIHLLHMESEQQAAPVGRGADGVDAMA
jgi:hypothetical protein